MVWEYYHGGWWSTTMVDYCNRVALLEMMQGRVSRPRHLDMDILLPVAPLGQRLWVI